VTPRRVAWCGDATDPASTPDIPADYLQRVKAMHESGGSGSIGYRYDWKEAEARRQILRTHTTAVSARMLYEIANVRRAPARALLLRGVACWCLPRLM
jgi:hypothetical protein